LPNFRLIVVICRLCNFDLTTFADRIRRWWMTMFGIRF